MKTYLVGGAVRDILLGIDPKDFDYVIVGATAQDVEFMISQGYKQVGVDFPVFLHPVSGEEYALARTERKVGVGYGGFEVYASPDVTLKEDLSRRDLTINAMAMDLESGEIIDPFGGRHDLAQGIIRHVSAAFVEDPLRVLRVGRFVARYGFSVADETFDLMKQLVFSGELKHVSRDRIWVELEKILGEKHTYFGLATLQFCGALSEVLQLPIAYTREMIRSSISGGVDRFDTLPDAYSKFAVLTELGFAYSENDLSDMRVPVVLRKQMKMLKKLDGKLYGLMHDVSVERQLEFVIDTGFANQMFLDVFPTLVFLDNADDDMDALFDDVMTLVAVVKSVDCTAIAAVSKNIPQDIKDARLNALRKFRNDSNLVGLG